MTTQERIVNLKRIKDMVWGLKESVRITKDGIVGVPPEIHEAIGSLAKAELALERAICKLTPNACKLMERRMCLRDKAKVCDLCHECDIDISQPRY